MKIFSFFVLFMFMSNVASAFDLKKLGDSIQLDLGGALKQLENGLNKQGNTQNGNVKTEEQPKLAHDDKVVSKMVKRDGDIFKYLCHITFIDSIGVKWESGEGVNTEEECERARKDYVKFDAKWREEAIVERERQEKEEEAEIKEWCDGLTHKPSHCIRRGYTN